MNTAQLPTKPDQVALTDAGRLEAKAKSNLQLHQNQGQN